MATQFKPEGYNSLSPYFIVKGAQKTIDLLKQVFDGTELRRYDRPDGTIMHAEVKIYDSVVMLSDATADYPPVPLMVHVYVPDVDQVFEKALKAGCVAIEAPQQKGDPDKRGMFKDFGGNFWAVATQLS